MRKISLITLLVCILLIPNSLKGQNVRDYYYPSNVEFVIFNQPSSKEGIKEVFYYEGEMDGVEILTKTMFVNGLIVTKTSMGLEITENEVKLISKYSSGMYFEGNMERFKNSIIFKLPAQGKKISWKDSNDPNNHNKYIAEFCNITVNGKSLSAIKVKKTPVENGKTLTKWTDNEYYVKGIGLYKIITESGKEYRILEKIKEKEGPFEDEFYRNHKDNEPTKHFILNTSGSILTDEDIKDISKTDLRLMRNEIFARHGLIFKSKDLQEYFSNKSWYKPQYEDVTHKLTNIEKLNIELILKHENLKK